MRRKELRLRRDLSLGDTSMEMRPDVLRLGRGRGVDVATNVEVVVVLSELRATDYACEVPCASG
jgi:hypothetical protein